MKRKFSTFVKTVLCVLAALNLISFIGCKSQTKNVAPVKISQVKHPDWSKNANIYEVNVRQYTNEGTFAAFQTHLPRLKKMGVDILWFMPVTPIGLKNRKGSMGSYYSVQDYKAVSPDYGTIEDFKKVVEEAHKLGMHVITDWVANHTSWDNPWITAHPEWYTKDSTGKNIISPVPDWKDAADLNFDNKEMRAAMVDALKFWLTETKIDGFRCDVAGMCPTDFWNDACAELRKVNPEIFMLAEAEQNDLMEKAFDMGYGWEFHHLMNKIAKGEKNAMDLDVYFKKLDTAWVSGAYKMYFTSNHDENSWNGSESERLKDGVQVFAVLAATVADMPLVYSGQEAGSEKRLRFFDKDTIKWDTYKYENFYTKLLELKKRNVALWNTSQDAKYHRLDVGDNKDIFAFVREKDNHKVFVILNLSAKKISETILGEKYVDAYTNVFTGEKTIFNRKTQITLEPWEYRVYEK